MRRPVLAAVAAATVLALSSCATGTNPAASPSAPASLPASTTAASPTGSAVPAIEVAGPAWTHVHNLTYDGQSLLLGTHEGLYQQRPGQQPQLLSQTPFDVMGLTFDGSRWLASGHPGPGQDLPADLGLRASGDGRSWTTVSLLGEVDFHRLTAQGSTVIGVSAGSNALLRSTDAGATWTPLDNPGVFDIVVKPADPTTVLATTQSGPIASSDGGTRWAPITGAPLLALLAWTSTGVYGIAPDGTVHTSTDDGTTWQRRGNVDGQPTAVAADGAQVSVLVGATVLESTDSGTTFRARLTGIGER